MTIDESPLLDQGFSKLAWPLKIFVVSTFGLAFTAAWSIAAVQTFAALLIILGIWLSALKTPRVTIPKSMSILILVFLFLVFISAVFSGHFAEAVPQFRKSWVLICFFPLAWFSWIYSPRRIIEFLIWGTALASAIGIYRYLTSDVLRATPFSGGYTTLAMFAVAMLPFAVTSLLDKNVRYRWIYIVAVILLCGGLLGSESRAGWLSGLIGVLLIGFFFKRKIVIIGVLLVAVIVLALPGGRHMLRDRFQFDRPGGFTSGRSKIWSYSITPLSHLPFFGYGPESFKRIFPREELQGVGDAMVNSWHSTPLDITVESGPLALITFLIMAAVTFAASWKAYFRAKKRSLLYLALFASIVAFYISAFSTNLLRDFMLSTLLVCLWALSFSNEPRKTYQPE